jgi:eukaryotic-like serine/threonine-protein kinase
MSSAWTERSMKGVDVVHDSALTTGATASPESELEALWDNGQCPDVTAFLSARAGPELTTEVLVSLLEVDQRRRWLIGQRVNLRSYGKRFPVLLGEPEAFFELLYHEILVREGLGEDPDPEEYAREFPELAPRLKLQFEVHDALSSVDLTGDDSDAVISLARADDGRTPEFPGYEILGEVGRGGMGIVYRARQVRPLRLVALKMILDGRFASEQELHRFENEVEAVAALDHPSAVPILEVGQQGPLHYFTMPFFSGGSLADAQERLLAEPRKSARLLIEIAGAVHHAHCRGILHRDLKPANILLDDAGRPYVTDFGLAKRSQAGTGLTRKGDVLGSPGFMAPEQASGDSGAVTTATDVYGLGAILYALLTGRAPFAERSFHQTIARLQSEPPEPPSRISRAVPRPLELICLKCLEKEPARRYASAQAVAQDLNRYLAGEPLEAKPVSKSARLWLWVRRHPTQSALAGALVFAMLSGAAVATALWLRAEASLKAERSARELLQLTTERLNRSHEQLERATELERDARLRAQDRFDLALRAVQDTIHGPGNTSILLLTDAQAIRQGVLQRIVDLYKKLHASLEGDHTPEGRSQLADSYDRLGELTAEIGSVDVARAAYAKAHDIRRELSASCPGDRRRLYDEAIAVIQRARFERSAGQPALALALYRQGHAQLESLAQANPGNERLWGDLGWCLGNIGALELRTDPEKALQTHLKVLDIRERLIDDKPRDVTLRSDRAWGRLDVALCLRRLNRAAEAVSWVELARVEFEAAHAESPRDVNVTVRLVDCLTSLADAQGSSMQPVASLDASQRACNLIDELARAHPEVPHTRRCLPGICACTTGVSWPPGYPVVHRLSTQPRSTGNWWSLVLASAIFVPTSPRRSWNS